MITQSFIKRNFFLSCLIILFPFLSACQKEDKNTLPGYLEAQYTYIAMNTNGTLKALSVTKGQTVKKDQLLFRLTPDDKNAKEKRGLSPLSGMVFDIYFTPGEWVSMGAPVLSLLDPKKIKIIFYASLSLLPELSVNQAIEVSYGPNISPIKAKIIFISPTAEYTPPVIYSNEEKNKLVYRIEAMPVANNNTVLHPGQPVTVHLLLDHPQ